MKNDNEIFNLFEDYTLGAMHFPPFTDCHVCDKPVWVGCLPEETYCVFCGNCGLVFGLPFGYGSRLHLANDWNYWNHREPVPEQLNLFPPEDECHIEQLDLFPWQQIYWWQDIPITDILDENQRSACKKTLI